MKSNENENTLMLVISPLNNIYSYDNNYSNNSNHVENFLKIISEYNKESDLSLTAALSFAIENKNNDEFRNYITKRIELVPFILKEFLQFWHEKKIKINLLTHNEQEIELIKFECELLNISDYVKILNKDYFLLEKIIILISENVKDLIEIKKKNNNIFTVFNFLIFNDTDDYLKLQEENVNILKQIKLSETNNISLNPSMYPNLIIESLRQTNIFIDYVNYILINLNFTDTNISTTYNQIISSFFKNQIKVLYIFDSKSSSKNYRKRELATSSRNILYTPFMLKKFGLDESLTLYKDHQVVLQRCPYLYFKDKQFCESFQHILNTYHKGIKIIHDMKVIDICFYRLNVYSFIQNFIFEIGAEIKEKFGINLYVPYSFSFIIEHEDASNDNNIEIIKNKLSQRIKQNLNFINFPLIIKPDACTEHEMFLILSEEGLNNFINKENISRILKSKSFICQKFIPHGGLMFKNYYINNSSFTITRPSLPDLEGSTLGLNHFKDGCFKFHNEFLYKKEDPSFWEGIEQSKINNSNNKESGLLNINYEALDFISKRLASTKDITLFGLDYLFDCETDSYFLLEINYFPSYRELGNKLRDQFEEHIKSMYSLSTLKALTNK